MLKFKKKKKQQTTQKTGTEVFVNSKADPGKLLLNVLMYLGQLLYKTPLALGQG